MALPFFRWDHFDKARLAAIAGNRLDKGGKVSELVHGGTEDRDATIVVVVIGFNVNGGKHCLVGKLHFVYAMQWCWLYSCSCKLVGILLLVVR